VESRARKSGQGLRLDHASYWIGPQSGTRVVVYTPLDEEARRRLEKLALIDFG